MAIKKGIYRHVVEILAGLRRKWCPTPTQAILYAGWRLHGCPRCHGDLWRQGWRDWSCRQCSFSGPTVLGTRPDEPERAGRTPFG